MSLKRHFLPIPDIHVWMLAYFTLNFTAHTVLAIWGHGPQGGHILASIMAALSLMMLLGRIAIMLNYDDPAGPNSPVKRDSG